MITLGEGLDGFIIRGSGGIHRFMGLLLFCLPDAGGGHRDLIRSHHG